MRRIILLVLALTLVIAVPSMAGRITSTMIQHFNQVYQACPANTGEPPDCFTFRGYLEPGPDVISSAPGILSIDPGGSTWPNFIKAAQENRPYTIKNTTLVKETPEFVSATTYSHLTE